jgi:hypothetical protein
MASTRHQGALTAPEYAHTDMLYSTNAPPHPSRDETLRLTQQLRTFTQFSGHICECWRRLQCKR